MKQKAIYLLITSLLFNTLVLSQNLLDTSKWTQGSGSVLGFDRNGNDSENIREYDTGPNGNTVLLWKAVNDVDNNADGGWNSTYVNVDHTKTYRFSVWLKKTNSNDGHSYFGCRGYLNGEHHILNLDGSVNTNPYFWHGDLPQLDKWYLLIGYVHSSDYMGQVNHGGIYDGKTGEKVKSIRDFKLKIGAPNLAHRAYLYYDTNVNDRQYFYAPRIEDNSTAPTIASLLGLDKPLAGNLIDVSRWEVGSGGCYGFSRNGSDAENSREWGVNHLGKNVMLWKATNDVARDADGGWNTSPYRIDHTKTYRLVIWLKKTNSNDGYSYFGTYSISDGAHHILNLNDNAVNQNPYFWLGDLPELNKWYMLVGFIHGSNYSAKTNHGGIYDTETGEKIKTIRDFKFKTTAKMAQHRAYLYYDVTEADEQYFWAPRLEMVTGQNIPSINELLQINEGSKVTFSYDNAGNQIRRKYCKDINCSESFQRAEHLAEASLPDELIAKDDKDEIIANSTKTIKIYPNPTSSKVTIKLPNNILDNLEDIQIYNTNAVLIRSVQNNYSSFLNIDLKNLPSGVYFVHLHIKGGDSITRKIVKN